MVETDARKAALSVGRATRGPSPAENLAEADLDWCPAS
jgi:hypothetical protein